MVCNEPQPADKSKPRPMLRRDATAFRRKFLASLTRQQGWTAGDALDFQRDLQIYEELLARTASTRRNRKPFEAAIIHSLTAAPFYWTHRSWKKRGWQPPAR